MFPTIRMYCTTTCPYCVMAENLLLRRGAKIIDKLRIDLDPALRQQMMESTGRRTVPQIFIGGTYVGGYDDLASLDRAEKLIPLLQSAAA
ncbi:MAG: glutaredoxin 3 [Betaproteobacteria bacterium]|nr:glutaredoxin 3 [Betaproteobacteria bacterium]